MEKNLVHLASASPRRRELLRQIGVPFEVLPAVIDEALRPGEHPDAYVLRMAREKALAACPEHPEPEPVIVLAADTVVVLDNRVLGKPGDVAAAERMLEVLSGRTHEVLTAVALRRGERLESVLSASEVRIRPTTAIERRAYCQTGEPLDKAGGYAVQGLAAVFIEHLVGSYSSVMGLPLYETAKLLAHFGLPAWLGDRDAA
jgi:septum formation protein